MAFKCLRFKFTVPNLIYSVQTFHNTRKLVKISIIWTNLTPTLKTIFNDWIFNFLHARKGFSLGLRWKTGIYVQICNAQLKITWSCSAQHMEIKWYINFLGKLILTMKTMPNDCIFDWQKNWALSTFYVFAVTRVRYKNTLHR